MASNERTSGGFASVRNARPIVLACLTSQNVIIINPNPMVQVSFILFHSSIVFWISPKLMLSTKLNGEMNSWSRIRLIGTYGSIWFGLLYFVTIQNYKCVGLIKKEIERIGLPNFGNCQKSCQKAPNRYICFGKWYTRLSESQPFVELLSPFEKITLWFWENVSSNELFWLPCFGKDNSLTSFIMRNDIFI